MINQIVLFLMTIALFALLLYQQKIKTKKVFFTLVFVAWIIASGIVFVQETTHQKIISESYQTATFPSQEIKK